MILLTPLTPSLSTFSHTTRKHFKKHEIPHENTLQKTHTKQDVDMYKGRKCLMCDNLYCRRCKRSEMVQLARRLYLCSQCVRRKKAQERIKTKPVGPCGKCGKKKLVAQHARRCPRCGAVRCGMCKKLDMFKHGKKIWTCRIHHPHVPQNEGFAIVSSKKSMVLPRTVTETKKKSLMDPVTACLRCASYFKQEHLMEGLWRRPGNQRVVKEMYVIQTLFPTHDTIQ